MIQFSKSKKWLVAASVLMVAFGCQCQNSGNQGSKCAPSKPSCDQNKCAPKPCEQKPSAPSCGGCSSSNQEEKTASPEVVQPTAVQQEVKEPVRATPEIVAPVRESNPETNAIAGETPKEANVEAKAEPVAAPAAEVVAAPFVETPAVDVATRNTAEVKE